MVQHIGLQCEDERGQVLARYDREGVPVEIVHHASSRSACLRFIDPYGDTVLNQLQLPVLIAELEEMARRPLSAELGGRLSKVVAFLTSCKGVHQHVRFMGD